MTPRRVVGLLVLVAAMVAAGVLLYRELGTTAALVYGIVVCVLLGLYLLGKDAEASG